MILTPSSTLTTRSMPHEAIWVKYSNASRYSAIDTHFLLTSLAWECRCGRGPSSRKSIASSYRAFLEQITTRRSTRAHGPMQAFGRPHSTLQCELSV